MIITRKWAMPNKWTFQIPPIRELLNKYVGDGVGWIDPFCGNSVLAEYRNDLNPESHCKSHVLADIFCCSQNILFEGVLFDPPYSGRQVKECYTNLNKLVHRDDTNAYFHANVKKSIANKIKDGGYAICCGWNTNGFGKKYGFELIEILLVAHGSSHNDTIVTVEKKVNCSLEAYGN